MKILSFAVVASTYIILKDGIIKSVDDTLTMQIDLIKNSIESSIDASIKNYFRASASAAYDVTEVYYEKYQQGIMSEAEAQDAVWSILKEREIGPNGYIAIMDQDGKMLYHPSTVFIGSDMNEFDFTAQVMGREENFVDYEWQNPEDESALEKSLYSIQFKPWGWYICVTGYRKEFMSLVSIDDIEDKILSIRFGETGYPLALDMTGTLLIHPEYKGVNMYDRQDSMGEVTRKAIQEGDGRAEYYWKNPGESQYYKKITLYRKIPQFEIIVAATAYEYEVMKPLYMLRKIMVLILVISLGLIVYFTRRVSYSITQPILELKESMDMAVEGNMDTRVTIRGDDEIGQMAYHFNWFIDTLQKKQIELGEQLAINSEITEELRASLNQLQETQQRLIEEERFSSMGRLVVKVSHQLNTPMGNALTAASYIERETDDLSHVVKESKVVTASMDEQIETISDSTKILRKALDSAIHVVDTFSQLKIDVNYNFAYQLNICDFFKDYYDLWKGKLPSNVELDIKCPVPINIVTIPEVLMLALSNLTQNSLEHAFGDIKQGKITIEAEQMGKNLKLIYADNGVGISKQDEDKIFEPFYSTSGKFDASGLGLSIVYNAIRDSLKGHIEYRGDVENGVRFIIELPNLVKDENGVES